MSSSLRRKKRLRDAGLCTQCGRPTGTAVKIWRCRECQDRKYASEKELVTIPRKIQGSLIPSKVVNIMAHKLVKGIDYD